jgi:hypothetical protein
MFGGRCYEIMLVLESWRMAKSFQMNTQKKGTANGPGHIATVLLDSKGYRPGWLYTYLRLECPCVYGRPGMSTYDDCIYGEMRNGEEITEYEHIHPVYAGLHFHCRVFLLYHLINVQDPRPKLPHASGASLGGFPLPLSKGDGVAEGPRQDRRKFGRERVLRPLPLMGCSSYGYR